MATATWNQSRQIEKGRGRHTSPAKKELKSDHIFMISVSMAIFAVVLMYA